MIMLNDLLGYNLKIYQNEDYFKFSIDSVLLAKFVDINLSTKRIMDFCTGNAPIPLILSLSFNKEIIGVEIQKEVYDLALKSIVYNNVINVKLINDDLNNLNSDLVGKFDIITCNPPYFKYNGESLINENRVKAIARHEICINLEDIIKKASELLNYSGSLYIVYRCDRLIELFNLLSKYHFGLRKLEFVYDNINSDSCFILVCAKYMCKDDLKVLKPLFIDKFLEEL